MNDGECEYCKMHDELEKSSNPDDLPGILRKIKRKGRRKQYDCIIGISGGMDSSLLLFWAVHNGLRPLVIHFDNGWNTEEAEHNMKEVTTKLGVGVIRYSVNQKEYDTLNNAFLWAGVPDMDIPNDIAMTKLMYETAKKYGIKFILNGHCFRTEGSTPRDWTYMDAQYVKSVFSAYTGGARLNDYPNFTFWDQVKYSLKGIKQVRPFHYMPIVAREFLERTMRSAINLRNYGGKHGENIYTEFIGSYMLPVKFGIDKRIVYLSARVRSGIMNKREAKIDFECISQFDIRKLKGHGHRMIDGFQTGDGFFPMTINDRSAYKRYNFKRYKWIIWIMMKLGTVPRTFYNKYAK